MLLIPTLILHVFQSQLVAVVGCNMVLHRNYKIFVGPDGFRFMVIIFESRIQAVCDVTGLMVLDNSQEIFPILKNANRTNCNTFFDLWDIRWNILAFNFWLSDYHTQDFLFICITLTYLTV
jgi:hypothetical protein